MDLLDLYGDVENSLRMTEDGLWHATPLPVLRAMVPLLESHARITTGSHVLDAGSGDGRVLAALALGLSCASSAKLWGLESDPALFTESRSRLARLSSENAPVVGLGSFLDEERIRALGVHVEDLDVVLNYPDGNEHALVQFLRRHAAPRCCLAIVSPETQPDVGFAASLRVTVQPPGQATFWTLSLFHPAA